MVEVLQRRREIRQTRTRIRDEERAPIASDLKRSMERAYLDVRTFALTAAVSEAHQVPIAKED